MGKIIGIAIIIAVTVGGYMLFSNNKEAAVSPANKEMAKPQGDVKEFTTTAFFDAAGAWFSLKEIRVKKGDAVRIKATNTNGMHDFSLDEFGIKKELPLNQEIVVEFVADKAGQFTYYCSKPGHRAKGQFGTLIVE